MMKIQLQLWAATPFQPPLGGTDKNEEWATLRITTHPHVGKFMLISKPHEKLTVDIFGGILSPFVKLSP